MTYRKIIILISIVIGLTSCNLNKNKIDLIIEDATIYTVDSSFSICSSLAIDNGKIVNIGTKDHIKKIHSSNNVLNAKGLYIYPGFIDAHCHLYGYALNSRFCDLTGAKSFDNIVEILKEKSNTDSEIIIGKGWDQNNWIEKEFKDNSILNETFKNKPVILLRIDGHAVIVNQAAIDKLKNINSTAINPKQAIIKNGKFTGLFLENTAESFRSLIENPDKDETKQLLVKAASECSKNGLTYVADAGLDDNIIDILLQMTNSNDLKLGIYAMLNFNERNIKKFISKGITSYRRMEIRSIKVYADGALGSRGACLIEPYHDSKNNHGIMTVTQDSLGRICLLAYDNGFQVCTHAIGDSAVRLALNTYSNYLLPNNDLRWRIEHAQIVNPDDIEKFGEYSIIPSIQTTHAISDMKWAKNRLGTTRLRNAYIYRTLMMQNGWIANGTDFPIENISPINSFYAAVYRKKNGQPKRGFQMENALTKEEALKSITIWAAKSCFIEKNRGSLEIGKFADFVILDKDIMQSNENRVLNTKVVATFFEGDKVYEDENNKFIINKK